MSTDQIKTMPNFDNEAEFLKAIEEFKDDQEVKSIMKQIEVNFLEIQELIKEFSLCTANNLTN
jgi:hypothetical protein